MAKFVKDYVQEDFEAYQASILRVQGKGITFEEYKKYYEQLSLPVLLQVRVRSGSESPETEKPTRKNYPNQKEYRTARKEYSIRKKAYELTLSQKFAILHAQYAKPIKLSAEGLCSCGEKIRKSRSVPITGETAMQVSRLKRLLLFALVSMPLGLYTIQASVRFTVDSLVLFVQIIFLMTIGGGLGYFSGRSAFLNLQVRNLTYREDKLLIMCERESIKIDNQNN
ncbi:MAG: hypothetical protein LBT55_01790 [Clostridiaceae bacterium]|nr:hypothetical protein [Clostridiaceae bacterium]